MPVFRDDEFGLYHGNNYYIQARFKTTAPLMTNHLLPDTSGTLEQVGHTHSYTTPAVGDLLAVSAGVKQTLHPLSGRTAIYDITNGTLTWPVTQTAAQAHDASDLTFDRALITGNHIDTPTQGEVGITYTLDTCTYGGVIDKITLRVRAIQDDCAAAEISPWFASSPRDSQITFTDSVAWYTWDFATNPRLAMPTAWTAESINAITDWGWWSKLTGADEFADPFCTAYEFEVLVYGTDLDRLAVGTDGKVLTAVAGAPAWAANAALGQTSALLSTTHTDTTAASVVRGDIIIGSGATPKWTRLGKGTENHVLKMGADEPAWAALPPVDAEQTWTTKQTFPADGTNCPVFTGDHLNDIDAFTMVDLNDGDPATLYVRPVNGGICYLKDGIVLTAADLPLAVESGGTGATSLAGAGISYRVGNAIDLTGQTGDIADQTLLATAHPAGFYRIMVHISCTTAGAAGSLTFANVKFSDGIAHTATLVLNNTTGDVYAGLTSTNRCAFASRAFYSSGGAAITCGTYVGTYNTNPQYSFRARLEYLGA